MFIHCIPAFVHKSIISTVALASVASVALLCAAEPAGAKQMTRCQVKHSWCTERCIMNSGHGEDSISKGNSCVARTCNHQFKACARASGESSDPYHDHEGMTGPKGGKGGRGRRLATPPQDGVRAPLGDGILGQSGGFSSQGPTATGTPRAPATPSAPPVIIR
jgi:hypothetical protein